MFQRLASNKYNTYELRLSYYSWSLCQFGIRGGTRNTKPLTQLEVLIMRLLLIPNHDFDEFQIENSQPFQIKVLVEHLQLKKCFLISPANAGSEISWHFRQVLGELKRNDVMV